MATFTVTIECDNAAFDDRNAEVASILADLSAFIGRKVCFLAGHPEVGSVRDANGNRVGGWTYLPDNPPKSSADSGMRVRGGIA